MVMAVMAVGVDTPISGDVAPVSGVAVVVDTDAGVLVADTTSLDMDTGGEDAVSESAME